MALNPIISSLDNAVSMVQRVTRKVTHPAPQMWGGGVDPPKALRPGEQFKPVKPLPNFGANIDIMA